MKKLILSIAIGILSISNLLGQTHEQNYISIVGDKVDVLLGSVVYPVDKSESLQEYGYRNFYTSNDKSRHFAGKRRDFSSPYSPLNRTKFNVTKIEKVTYGKYMIELQDIETGEFVYYEHSTLLSRSELALVEIPSTLYASQISSRKDRLEDKITYSTPYGENVAFTKVVRGTDTVTYLSLSTYGSTLNVLEKGATILFTDGTQLKFPDIDIKTKAHTATSLRGYDYSIFKSLTTEEIEIFSTKTIEYFKLYVYDREIKEKDGKKYNAYMNLLK
tara:strand:+ start:309 stop:1130 length:822 start_codon:yes stop_codon:yes gene_type:complete